VKIDFTTIFFSVLFDSPQVVCFQIIKTKGKSTSRPKASEQMNSNCVNQKKQMSILATLFIKESPVYQQEGFAVTHFH